MADTSVNEQAKAAFDKHHEEIQRRRNVSEMETTATSTSFEPAKTQSLVVLPFELPEQRFVLYSVSHVCMPPIAEDCTQPGIRLYGTFASREDALDHAREVQRVDGSCNLQLSATHTWFCMAASPDRVADDAACRAHVTAVLDAETARRDHANQEFEKNRSKHSGGAGADPSRQAQTAEAARRAVEAAKQMKPDGTDAASLRRAPKLGRAAEVRDQSFLVASFLPDVVQDLPEPLVRVYAAFGTEEEADVYVRNVVGEHVTDVDVYVVSACEWLHPQAIDASKIKSEVFRATELSRIMDNHKSQPSQVEKFRAWREAPPAAPELEAAAQEARGETSRQGDTIN